MTDRSNAIKLKSRPKFLEPYGRQDAGRSIPDEIAVRSDVLDRLYALHKRTTIMVLHGPSGSGKTSIVNSGFVKQINIPPRAVFNLTREPNFLEAFTKQLEEKGLDTEIGTRIQVYIDAVEELSIQKKEIDDINNQILAREELGTKEQEANSDSLSINELVAKREEIKKRIKNESNVKQAKSTLISDFNHLFAILKSTPLLIFDQFEEMFTEGNKKERTRFGILSRFLLTAGVPANSLLIVEEEYFGFLDEFIEYIPKIFYNSVRLLDPDREKAAVIIKKLIADTSSAGVDDVVQQLINQFHLKNIDTTNKIEKQHIHLPFLQVYLKAYEDQFGENITTQKIAALGRVDEVLEDYLEGLNNRILRKFGVQNLDGLKQEYPVVKYLKNFVSVMTGQAQKFKVQDVAKLQANIWPVDSEEKLDLEKFNLYLEEEGILNKRGDQFELAHDSLAIPINNFNIREDLHKKDFETSFQIWNQKGEGNSSPQPDKNSAFQKVKDYFLPKDLLSKGQVNSMAAFKEYIIPSDSEQRSEKLWFWRISRINVKKWNILGLIVMAAFVFGLINTVRLRNNSLKDKELALIAVKKQVQAEKAKVIEQKKGALKGEVYEGTGEAWNAYRNDRTSAFSEIQRSFLRWDSGDTALTKAGDFPEMVSDFQNVFYSDYNDYPFYFKNIELDGGGYITQTKTRMVGDSLLILALTTNGELYTYRLDWKNKKGEPEEMFTPIKRVKHFEPFYNAKKELNILVITNDGKVLLDKNILNNQLDTLDRINGLDIGNLSGLEHIEGNNFVVSSGRSLYDLVLHDRKRFGMIYRESVPGEVMQIRHIPDFQHDYIVRYGRSGLYLSSINGEGDGFTIKKSNKSHGKIPSDRIYTLTYDKKKQRLLLGYNRGIVMSCDRYGDNVKQMDFRHREAISSIDVEGDMYLVASLDKTASVWRKKKLIKTLIGHNDALYNVSFIDGTDYVISSGEDSSIKMWDLSPTHKREATIPGSKMITQIKYDPVRASYIVGYKSLNSDENKSYEGKVLTYDDSLKWKGEIDQDRKYGNGTGYINTFDYKDNVLVMAGNANQVITTARENRRENIILTGITSTIHDIEISDSTIYIGTTKGLLYNDLYRSSNTKYDTLSKGHRVNAISFSAQNNLLAVAREDGLIILYRDHLPIDTLFNHTDKVADIEFSETGKYLASGGWDNKVFIWKMENGLPIQQKENGQPILPFEDKHLNDVRDIEFYKDSLLLAGGLGRTVKLYRSNENGGFNAIPSLMSHNSSITAATFSRPNETGDLFVLSGDRNGILRLWNISNFTAQIQTRTFDKIKEAREIAKQVEDLKGVWSRTTDSSLNEKSFPEKITFKHPPELLFTSEENNSIWEKEKENSARRKSIFRKFRTLLTKNIEGSYNIPKPNLINVTGEDTTLTFNYQFQLLSDSTSNYLELITKTDLKSDTIKYKRK